MRFLQIVQLFFTTYLGSFVQLKYLIVQFQFDYQSLLMLVIDHVLISPKRVRCSHLAIYTMGTGGSFR